MKILSLCLLLTLACSQLIRFPLKKHSKRKPRATDILTNFALNTGHVTIKNYFDNIYTAPIQIGSQNQTFELVVDTGSDIVWIPAPQAETARDNGFNCSESTSCHANISETTTISYGRGYIKGYLITDQVSLGDLIIPSFNVLLADTIKYIDTESFDGIFGLSLQQSNTYSSIVYELKKYNLTSSDTFSIYLGSNSMANGIVTGELIFGGYDPKYLTEEFKFIDLEENTTHWRSRLKALGFGTSVNFTNSTGLDVLFDSGTSLIIVPEDLMQGIVSEASKFDVGIYFDDTSGIYGCSCRANTTLPSLFAYMGNHSFEVPASVYIEFSVEQEACYIGIQGTGVLNVSTSQSIILGDVFLKNYYSLYSADNYTIGLARINSSVSIGSEVTTHVSPGEDNSSLGWEITVGVTLLLVFVGIVVLFIFKIKKKKDIDENSRDTLLDPQYEGGTL